MPITKKTTAQEIVIVPGPVPGAASDAPEGSTAGYARVLVHLVYDDDGEASEPTPNTIILTDPVEIVEIAGLLVGYDPTKANSKATVGAVDAVLEAKLNAKSAEVERRT